MSISVQVKNLGATDATSTIVPQLAKFSFVLYMANTPNMPETSNSYNLL